MRETKTTIRRSAWRRRKMVDTILNEIDASATLNDGSVTFRSIEDGCILDAPDGSIVTSKTAVASYCIYAIELHVHHVKIKMSWWQHRHMRRIFDRVQGAQLAKLLNDNDGTQDKVLEQQLLRHKCNKVNVGTHR